MITALKDYDNEFNYINKLMTMEARRIRKICADNDEAPKVVGVDVSVVGSDEDEGIVGVRFSGVVDSASDSHAETIFTIASSKLCTSNSNVRPKVLIAR